MNRDRIAEIVGEHLQDQVAPRLWEDIADAVVKEMRPEWEARDARIGRLLRWLERWAPQAHMGRADHEARSFTFEECGLLSCSEAKALMQEDDGQTLILVFDRLPDMEAVGGNARHGHFMERGRAYRQEQETWIGLIREQLIPPMPRFDRALAKATLTFPVARRRDVVDNIPYALKPLWDAMRHWEILTDDDQEHLEVYIDVQTSPGMEQTQVKIERRR